MEPFTVQLDLKTGGIAADTLLDDKQARYAMMLALNRTAEEINASLGRQIKSTMIVRKPAFILPPTTLPRAQRATKDNLVAIAGLTDSGGLDDNPIRLRRAGILAPFETGGVKREASELRPVAVPTSALRPDRSQLVPRQMYPTSLRLQPRAHAFAATKTTKGHLGILQAKSRRIRGLTPGTFRTQIVGNFGTFVLDPKVFPGISPKAWGVYQRFGPGKRDIRMIWSYREQVAIPHLLNWYADADRIVQSNFYANWQGFYEFAMRTAK